MSAYVEQFNGPPDWTLYAPALSALGILFGVLWVLRFLHRGR